MGNKVKPSTDVLGAGERQECGRWREGHRTVCGPFLQLSRSCRQQCGKQHRDIEIGHWKLTGVNVHCTRITISSGSSVLIAVTSTPNHKCLSGVHEDDLGEGCRRSLRQEVLS